MLILKDTFPQSQIKAYCSLSAGDMSSWTCFVFVTTSGSCYCHFLSDCLCLHPVCDRGYLVACHPTCQTTYLPINLWVCLPALSDKEPWLSVVLTPADLCQPARSPICEKIPRWITLGLCARVWVCLSDHWLVRLCVCVCVWSRWGAVSLLLPYHIPHNLQTFFNIWTAWKIQRTAAQPTT